MLINTDTIPIVVVSSRTPLGNHDAALKSGGIAYIHQPVDMPVLLKAIHEALGMPLRKPLRSLLSRHLHPSPDLRPERTLDFFSIESDPRTVYTKDKVAAALTWGNACLTCRIHSPISKSLKELFPGCTWIQKDS
jgi:DNA-binding response OmpR family regulator